MRFDIIVCTSRPMVPRLTPGARSPIEVPSSSIDPARLSD